MKRARNRWTAEEKRIAMEQRLRAQTIPSKRFSGPDKKEWDYTKDHARSR